MPTALWNYIFFTHFSSFVQQTWALYMMSVGNPSKIVHHALVKPGQVKSQHVDWPLLDIDKASPKGETQT
jgi:hypothetical protein